MARQYRRTLDACTPIVRTCVLCEQPKPVSPSTEGHRRAHLAKQLAFVCEECAGRVRTEVELAASRVLENPRATA